jgi:hypothetical protein
MKEEEAKTKRCGGPNGCGTLINPASRGRIPQEMLLQLAVEVNSPRWCIASDCMMWEWETVTIGDTDHDKIEGNCGLKR